MNVIILFEIVSFTVLICAIIILAIEKYHQRLMMIYRKEIAKIDFVIKCKEAKMTPEEIMKEWKTFELK